MKPAPRLCPRLETAAIMAGGCGRIADIGTDHALLPVSLLLDKKAEFALLADIAAGPLTRALATVTDYELADKVEFCLSNGFENVDTDKIDTSFICGMGGVNIICVLAGEKFAPGKRFILQPQTDALNLRAFLLDSGFEITAEKGVCDRGHAYTVIAAVSGDIIPRPADGYIKFNPKWADDPRIALGRLDPSKPDDAAFLRHTLKLYLPKAKNLAEPAYTRLVNTLKEALNENGQ